MSFFNDFLESFKLNDTSDKIILNMVVGVGIMIVGKIKIMNLDSQSIVIKANGKNLCIMGEELKIKSVAKGEILVSGNILKIDLGEHNG